MQAWLAEPGCSSCVLFHFLSVLCKPGLWLFLEQDLCFVYFFSFCTLTYPHLTLLICIYSAWASFGWYWHLLRTDPCSHWALRPRLQAATASTSDQRFFISSLYMFYIQDHSSKYHHTYIWLDKLWCSFLYTPIEWLSLCAFLTIRNSRRPYIRIIPCIIAQTSNNLISVPGGTEDSGLSQEMTMHLILLKPQL